MALLLLLSIYGIYILLFSFLVPLEMGNGIRFLFNVFGGISVLVVPFLIYSYFDLKLTLKELNRIGLEWCNENNMEYMKTDVFKNHIALIYKDNGKKERKKYIHIAKFLSWETKEVRWL